MYLSCSLSRPEGPKATRLTINVHARTKERTRRESQLFQGNRVCLLPVPRRGGNMRRSVRLQIVHKPFECAVPTAASSAGMSWNVVASALTHGAVPMRVPRRRNCMVWYRAKRRDVRMSVVWCVESRVCGTVCGWFDCAGVPGNISLCERSPLTRGSTRPREHHEHHLPSTQRATKRLFRTTWLAECRHEPIGGTFSTLGCVCVRWFCWQCTLCALHRRIWHVSTKLRAVLRAAS